MAKRNKLQKILAKWPNETILLSKKLDELGISRQLQGTYVKSGWIQRIGVGAYKKTEDKENILGAVYAIQKLQGLSVHIAGYSSLSLQSIEHHITMEEGVLGLIGVPGLNLPAWFKNHWSGKFAFSRSNMFSCELGLKQLTVGDFSVIVSTPERAFLEVFSQVKTDATFENAAETFFSYLSWDLKLCHQLLIDCKSARAKRMFLFLLDRHVSKSIRALDKSGIDCGSGVIQFVKKGKYLGEYNIMVPDSFAVSEGSEY